MFLFWRGLLMEKLEKELVLLKKQIGITLKVDLIENVINYIKEKNLVI